MDTNPLIPVYTALGGIIVGALASFLPAFILERLKRKIETEAITGEIVSEIRVTLYLIEKRKYLEHLETALAALRGGDVSVSVFQVMVPNDYSPIFRSHLGKLGFLPVAIRDDVVTFYHLLAAVVGDVRVGGQTAARPRGEAEVAQLHEIASEAIRIARRILGHMETLTSS